MAEQLDELGRGRACAVRGAWVEAYEALSGADRTEPLCSEDIEVLARSAYMLGRDADYLHSLERAHHAYLDADEALRAVRCAFWIGHNFLFRGEIARARGWFARAHRLLVARGEDCVERGYLLIPVWLEQMGSGDYEAGYETAAEAAVIGERFGDADLVWLAMDERAEPWSARGESRRDCDSSMTFSGSPSRVSCLRWSPASSTATRLLFVEACTSCGTRWSGPMP